MRIRHRLTIFFSLSFTFILLVFGLTVYFFSSHYSLNEFNNQLMQRIFITEKMLLEKNTFTAKDYEKIKEEFLLKLPEESAEVVPVNKEFKETFKRNYPASFINKLLEEKQTFFSDGPRRGAGKIFQLPGGTYLVMVTAIDLAGIKKLTYLRTIIVLALALCFLVTYFVSYYISAHVLKPISNKIKMANNISINNLHKRLSIYNPDDEIGELAIAFNHLLDRLEQAFNTQKLFISNASHEIRTPLTVIIGEAELALEKDRSQQEYIESLKSISGEADRLNLVVNNLLQLSKISYNETNISFEKLDLEKLIISSRDKFDFLYPDNLLIIRNESASGVLPASIIGNTNLLASALINIFDNAIKFSAGKGKIIVSLTRTLTSVTISVKDRGIGIPKDEIEMITQPFYRASNSRQINGSGIGMSLTLKIVELHKGSLKINSELYTGTQVEITFPLVT